MFGPQAAIELSESLFLKFVLVAGFAILLIQMSSFLKSLHLSIELVPKFSDSCFRNTSLDVPWRLVAL